MANTVIESLCIRELTAEVWLLLPVYRFLGFHAKKCSAMFLVSLFLDPLHVRLEVI